MLRRFDSLFAEKSRGVDDGRQGFPAYYQIDETAIVLDRAEK